TMPYSALASEPPIRYGTPSFSKKLSYHTSRFKLIARYAPSDDSWRSAKTESSLLTAARSLALL
ncbi:hypothetical protein PRA76_27335, partial [Klebsiella pneumoniae]|uniref:hypothetical protein n=1 Tax=Klebsiella pneumoniae TaxID=573 RepID=UPI002E7FC628